MVLEIMLRISSSSSDLGALASLSIVVSGFGLAAFAFHLLRIGPARRLASGVILAEAVRAHLEDRRARI